MEQKFSPNVSWENVYGPHCNAKFKTHNFLPDQTREAVMIAAVTGSLEHMRGAGTEFLILALMRSIPNGCGQLWSESDVILFQISK